MTLVLNLLGLGAVSAALSVKFRESLAKTVPVVLCSVGLLLYILAFFGAMGAITPLMALAALGLLIYLALRVKRDGRAALRAAVGPLLDMQVWINAAAVAAVILLVNYRLITEWDAFNFWGPDIKSLYYREGFAGSMSNVAPGFGDYPPMTQLIIWWFLNLFGRFDEGLIFGGYFFYTLALLFSVTGALNRSGGPLRRLLTGAACVLLLFALPGVADSSWYRSLYVDPVMGMLFGCLVVEITGEGEWNGWRTVKCAVYLACLTLTKSVGLLWAVYALVLFFLWRGMKGRLKTAASMAAPALLAFSSWALFCLLMKRSTYLTVSIAPSALDRARELLNGSFFKSERTVGFIRTFFKALLTEPVHRELTAAVDLTPAAVFLAVMALTVLIYRSGRLDRRGFRKLLIFVPGMYAVTYLILLASHLTIFYGESQYLESANMLTQMTRYGGPMSIGMLMWAFAACAGRPGTEKAPGLGAYLPGAMAALIVLCAGYPIMGDCLIEGYDDLNPKRYETRDRFEAAYATLCEELEKIPLDGENRRVLVLVNTAETNPIVTFLASPVSIEFISYDENLDAGAVYDAAARCGAKWVFVQDGEGPALDALEAALPGCRVGELYPLD